MIRMNSSMKDSRGAALIAALLLAVLMALGLASYLALSRTSMGVSQRNAFQGNAHALAEAGLEEALFCFRKVAGGSTVSTAWSEWTRSGANATRTLPAFTCDQNALGTVKVLVLGHDGSLAAPAIYSQAIITPFDGSAPVIRTLRLTLKRTGFFSNGIVGIGGLTWNGQPMADSFLSNPSGSTAGPWTAYDPTTARSNTTVVVLGGAANLGALSVVKGNMSIASGITPPPANKVTGTIYTSATGSYPLPTYPTAAGVSQSYNLGASIPATLPRTADAAAADGRFYYFANGATLAGTTIATGKAVVLVGTNTNMKNGLVIKGTGSLAVYIDGPVEAKGNGAINNENWAGALQIFTSTTQKCTIGGNGTITGCLYAPNADLTCNGGGNSGQLIGSFVAKSITSNGHMDFHYDETLRNLPGGGLVGDAWYNFQSAADRALVRSLGAGFLE